MLKMWKLSLYKMKNDSLEAESSSWASMLHCHQLSLVKVASPTNFSDPLFPNLKMEEFRPEK